MITSPLSGISRLGTWEVEFLDQEFDPYELELLPTLLI